MHTHVKNVPFNFSSSSYGIIFVIHNPLRFRMAFLFVAFDTEDCNSFSFSVTSGVTRISPSNIRGSSCEK